MAFSAVGAGGRALWRSYEGALQRHPIAIQSTTSAILWGCGDYLAQKGVERRAQIDGRRVALTSLFGAGFMGPVGHCWYLGLDTVAARLLKPGSPGFVAAKVIADTVILGPIYVLAFYAFGSCMIDGTGWEGFRTKITKDFAATYMAELCIWPAFQTFNFNRVPVDHQLLAVNLMTLVDASFLSYARSQDDWVASLSALINSKPEDAAGKVAQ